MTGELIATLADYAQGNLASMHEASTMTYTHADSAQGLRQASCGTPQ
jgi:hypothetical protein